MIAESLLHDALIARYRALFFAVTLFTATFFSTITASAQIPDKEFAERRQALMEIYPEGLILFKARSTDKGMEPWGWIQNASFLYFTGLANQPAAILVLDGPSQKSILFVPADPLSFGQPVRGLSLKPGADTARQYGFSDVQPWDNFQNYVADRLRAGIKSLYIEQPRRRENPSVPESMAAVSGDFALWAQSLRLAFPEATFKSAVEGVRALRWRKSDLEAAILRRNAGITAQALKEGARRIRPGASQRVAESAVVAGCIAAGGEGPSFWPWMMSGPNTNFPQLVRSFYDYNSLNRIMQAGELVRVDVGCASQYYGGDVGRTIPVSGRFSDEQRAVWDLLIAGYFAGIGAMRDGVAVSDIRKASRAAIRETVSDDEGDSESARRAIARAMLSESSGVSWHLHGVGIESGEELEPVLVSGAVIAYEPGFTWENESYYLEDMILIHQDHGEILSIGLPYSADEIESFMAPGKPSATDHE